MAKIKFKTPEGEYLVEIDYILEFPRSKTGDCAFCAGDPCNQYPNRAPDYSQIAKYEKDYKECYKDPKFTKPRTCPMCDGRPT